MKLIRALDANINRSSEGLRVLEDMARFRFDHARISADLRGVRHKIRDLFKDRQSLLLASRQADRDVGTVTSAESMSDTRTDEKDIVLSNFRRVQEALRSIEEHLKAIGEHKDGKYVETLRFDTYSLERRCLRLFAKSFPSGIYGILGEKFSLGRTNVEVARAMVDAGIDILQYREKVKDKSFKEMLNECEQIRKITADANVPFIINDHVAIALMVGADGVQQGQDDLPIPEVKKLCPEMMVGCSTHSPAQAKKAVEDGADYIGVGPIYTTQTKEDVCNAVGLSYLEHVVATHDIPFVAIGGIKRHNLAEVAAKGAKTICLVTEIIGADNIEKRIKEIKDIIGDV
ncbi:thiamine phosphate synthase [Desulfotignum phosphitoxidans]|uniref:Thiamine-phosphate synthase n=1 Tax=Desulfotignum phosphitoxidans DSM 13687 TaxID=1286635 RepID=S0G2C4_9BACT|nr:thiamine phosphate synthase [Desulfotignum phosphitoxidans]EMS81498.1 thiamine-phosphate pyrophosphorylase ThiE [Desulfotignum phosphitoxidans DSM 13687]